MWMNRLFAAPISISIIVLFTTYYVLNTRKSGTDPLRKTVKNNTQLEQVELSYHFESYATTTTKPSNKPMTNVTTDHPTDLARPTACDDCFKRQYSYLLNSPNVCGNVMAAIDLLVIVTSITKHSDRREAIRLTWLSVTRQNTHPHIRHIFLFGNTNEAENEQLKEESKVHHDLVQQSFQDSYKNLTLKTLMGLEWAGRFCPTAKYIMKTDDDMFVNVTNVLRLTRQPNLDKVVFGACRHVAYPIRDVRKKAYVSKLSYPEDLYPGYCSGTGYVMSGRVASDIVRISPSVPYLHLEDVYTALCVKRLGYKLKAIRGFRYGRVRMPENGCGRYVSPNLYTSHQNNPETLQTIWAACGVQETWGAGLHNV